MPATVVSTNDDVVFGPDVTYEDLLAKKDKLFDMSTAKEGAVRMRQMREQMAAAAAAKKG